MVTITEKDPKLQYTAYSLNLQKISKHFMGRVCQMDNLHSELEHNGATLFGVPISFNNQRTPATFSVLLRNARHFSRLFYIKPKVFLFLI